MSEFMEVKLSESRFANLLFLEVEIQGKVVVGMFDTGASMTVMKENLVTDLGIKMTESTVCAGNNNGMIFNLKTANIPSLKIGGLKTKNISAMIVKEEAFSFGEDENGQFFPADLLIGWDVISQYAWKCDMSARTLLVKEGSSLPKANDISWNKFPLFHATWNNFKFIAGLDTGHTETMLNSCWEDRLNDFAWHDVELCGIGSSQVCRQKYAKKFAFCYHDLFISLQNIDIVEQIHGAFPEMETLFGIDILHNKKWELDFLSGRFIIE